MTTMTKWIIGIGVFLLIAFGVGMYISMKVSYMSKEVALRKGAESEVSMYGETYDKGWKTIRQLSEVPERHAERFEKIYKTILESSGREGGDLFKMVQENNPKYDDNLYAKLANAIEENRAEILEQSRKTKSVCQAYNTFKDQPIAKFFLGDKPDIIAPSITSTRTKEALASGKDDDVSVFADTVK